METKRDQHHRRLLKLIQRVRKVERELKNIRSALGWLTHPGYYRNKKLSATKRRNSR